MDQLWLGHHMARRELSGYYITLTRGPEAEFVPEPVEVPEALRAHRVTPPDVSCYQQLVMPGVES